MIIYNNFSREFNILPIKLQKFIIIQILIYYEQTLSSLITKINVITDKINIHENSLKYYRNLIKNLMCIYKNHYNIYSEQISNNAYDSILNIYNIIDDIKINIKLNKKLLTNINKQLNFNRNKYSYHYNKFEKIIKIESN